MKPRARALTLLAVALFAAAVGLVFLATDALRGPERGTVDKRFDIRGKQTPRSDVVLVGIDSKALNAYPEFPFDRGRHANVIRQLTKAGAAVIAYDVQFTQPSKSAAADNALINAVRAGAPHVVLATTAVDPGGKTEIFGGGAGLKYSRATPGFSGFERDPDGVARRVSSARENGLEDFTLAAVRRKLGHAVDQPPRESTYIDYAGPPGTIPTLSFADVDSGAFDPEAVRGKIVFVGATAKELQDLHRTPVSDRMPGTEVEANWAATALNGFPLRDAPGWLDALLVVVLAAVAPLVAIRFGTWVGVAAGLVAAGLFLVAAQLTFNDGTVLTVIPALIAGATATFGTLLLATPVGHPRINRVLDALSPGSGKSPHAEAAHGPAARRRVRLHARRARPDGRRRAPAAGPQQRRHALRRARGRADAEGRRGRRHRRPDDQREGIHVPVPAYAPRQGDPAAAQGGRGGDRDGRPVHAAERQRRRGQRADHGRTLGRADGRPGHHRGRPWGQDRDLRRRGGAQVQPRHPVVLELREGPRRRDPAHARWHRGTGRVPGRRGPGQARTQDRRAAGRSITAWIDFAGPPHTVPYLSFVDVERRALQAVGRQGEDRRGRRDRFGAAGPARDVDHRSGRDAGDRGPRERDPDRAGGLPAPQWRRAG